MPILVGASIGIPSLLDEHVGMTGNKPRQRHITTVLPPSPAIRTNLVTTGHSRS
jgi:hypothetical protein